ncbi:MAG: type II toxin-antitoxin system prevent-host-death family antitoxin [Vicinamibacteria bacterium]|jgi:prevent-host-death family protein|nr:type II toxin-antitoxin system prevent-host-death family antitoxin [Vicinamibacteria bacterium]
MSTIGAYEAKTHLPALLERVERGEQFTITRHGKAIARLVPLGDPPQDASRLVDELRQIRSGARLRGLSVRKLRDTGRP